MNLKHSLTSTYFDSIDNPRKAYWLGYLFSDGSLGKNNSISLSCQWRDVEILERFKIDIGSSAPITEHWNPRRIVKKRIVESSKMARFICHNKHMHDRLVEIGGGRKKDERNSLPSIPTEFMKDFIRGYFDGDGCIYKRKGKKCNHYYISFCGKSNLLFEMSQFISLRLGIKSSRVYDKTDQAGSSISWGGNNIIKKFFEHFYDSDFCLDRKRNLFLECLSQDMSFKKRNESASKKHFFRTKDGEIIEISNLMKFVEENPQFKYTNLINLSRGCYRSHKGLLFHVRPPIQN